MESPIKIGLWPSEAPTSNGLSGAENNIEGKIDNISKGELYAYLPKNVNCLTPAVLIFPGGGFSLLQFENHGVKTAQWLVEHDIAAIVVKYRLPNQHYEIPLEDAQQAMTQTKLHAKNWRIDPQKIGAIGFSIGGNTVARLGNLSPEAIKPKFTALFYPVLSMMDGLTHVPTREKLIGSSASENLYISLSAERSVNKATSPCFLVLCNDDPIAPPVASLLFYEELLKCKIKSALHIFAKGGHGWGLYSDFRYATICKELLLDWIKSRVQD
ncbi:MAG: alpha/beta hydrolase [Tannerellaceae bacterium]